MCYSCVCILISRNDHPPRVWCVHTTTVFSVLPKIVVLGLGGVPGGGGGGGCYGRSMRSREASWRYEREREEEKALLRYSVSLQFSAPALALVSASHWHDFLSGSRSWVRFVFIKH